MGARGREPVHTSRVVPLDGRPSLSDDIRQWSGDSRGHWEGDTLVIETANFNAERRWRGSTKNMMLVERLTRLDPDTVAYEYTVTDSSIYTAPYTVMMPLRRTDGPLFEYACHEGNIGLHGILAGARNLELQGRELRP